MMTDGNAMFFGGGGMWFFWIILFVVLVWIVKSVTDYNAGNKSISDDDSPLDILKKRYARGEIDEQEYIRRRKELES